MAPTAATAGIRRRRVRGRRLVGPRWRGSCDRARPSAPGRACRRVRRPAPPAGPAEAGPSGARLRRTRTGTGRPRRRAGARPRRARRAGWLGGWRRRWRTGRGKRAKKDGGGGATLGQTGQGQAGQEGREADDGRVEHQTQGAAAGYRFLAVGGGQGDQGRGSADDDGEPEQIGALIGRPTGHQHEHDARARHGLELPAAARLVERGQFGGGGRDERGHASTNDRHDPGRGVQRGDVGEDIAEREHRGERYHQAGPPSARAARRRRPPRFDCLPSRRAVRAPSAQRTCDRAVGATEGASMRATPLYEPTSSGSRCPHAGAMLRRQCAGPAHGARSGRGGDGRYAVVLLMNNPFLGDQPPLGDFGSFYAFPARRRWRAPIRTPRTS